MSSITSVEFETHLRSRKVLPHTSGPRIAKNYAQFLDICESSLGDNYTLLRAVFFVDADNLKQINGSLGHAAGDDLIDRIKGVLFENSPEGSVLLRKGGDEFVSFCTFSSMSEINDFAEKLCQSLNRPATIGNQKIEASCSIGVSTHSGQYKNVCELIENADIALNWAKRNGKRQYKFFDLKDCAEIQYERTLTNDFEAALLRETLKVHYQPIFTTFDRQIVGAEALIRWDHADHGSISTELIISTASKAGKLRDLGSFVLREGCRMALTWPSNFLLSLNFSASDFQYVDFAEDTLSAISEIGIDFSRLSFEITEVEYLIMNDTVRENLRILQQAGIQVGVDDFGTGYSSMGSIDRFPADFVKIDRSLVENCDRRQSSKIFLRAIRAVAQNEGLRTIAEGVETIKELAIVSSIGIDLAQGFLCSPALTAPEFQKFVDVKERIRTLAKPAGIAR